MRFSVLGPLEACRDDRVLRLGGGRQRKLLALLLIHAGEIVSRDRLIDELWSGAPPAGAQQSLDSYVSRLRKALREAGAGGLLVTRAPGYVLSAADIDAARFEAMVDEAREAAAAGGYARAAELLRGALALWRGRAYVEVADEMWARPEAERLEELRLAALEERIEAELALGQHVSLVPELELLAGRHPTRERLAAQLMLALYRGGRQADALAAYQTARRSLVEQLGLEPGPELRRLEAAVLAQDAALDLPVLEAPPPVIAPPRTVSEGERKQVTVLCAEVLGLMELGEQTDPEELRQITERFLSILAAGVHRLAGTVEKFTGDGIMALFGAPIAHEDHARRGCYAALDLKRELASYADELRARGLEFSVRVGLHSGEVVVGTIAEDLGIRYTAIGHAVGLAQRMQRLARPGGVYMTQATASLISGYFDLRDLGEREVNRVSRPVRVYELIDVAAAGGAFEIARTRGLSRFVGRGHELATMEDARERAFNSGGRLIGIVGEAGVGKSRLCHEFAERQRTRGIPVYSVAGQSHAKAVPLLPVLQFLRSYFAISERDPDSQARERITARLLELDPTLGQELPLIFEFLAVADPERPAEQIDPEARQRRLLTFMKRLTRAQGTLEPAVTVIEDLHWLDPASETFLANHIDAIQGTRGLSVVTFRPEYHGSWMSRSYYQQIALEPLSREAIDELLADLLGNDPSLDSLIELVSERAQGNPFFIEEVVRSLVDDGTLEGEPGDYRPVRPLDEIVMPASVHAVLAARIDRLHPREKALLQTAAVIGRDFPQPVLEQVTDLEPQDLDEALHDLIAGELIYERELHPEPLYSFKHPLTREVAYRSPLTERRQSLHAAVARALAERYADRLDEQAALLAQHHEHAGETLDAAQWYARAAAWSGASDPERAQLHWQKVSELTDRLPESPETMTLGLQARISWLHYSWRVGTAREEAEAVFADAERIISKAGDTASRANLLATYGGLRGYGEGDHRSHAKLARQALALAEEPADPALHMSLAPFVFSLVDTGEYREAISICDRAIEMAQGDPTVGAGGAFACPYAFVHAMKGLLLGHLGELPDATRLVEEGRKLAREHGDIEVVAWSHMWSNWVEYFVGDTEAALVHAQRGIEIAERIGGSTTRALGWFHVGLAERMRKEWRRAVEALERSSTIAKERRLREHDGWRLALLGESYVALGDPERAREMVAEGLEIAHTRQHLSDETHANLALARVLLGSTGPAARAEIEGALARALELARATDAKSFEPLIHLELAELAHQSGDHETHERELRAAHRSFTEIGATGHAARLAAVPELQTS